MPIPTDPEILSRVAAFAESIVSAVRAETLDTIRAALGVDGDARRGRRAVSSRGAPGRRRGAKRDPGDIAALTERLGDFISKNPGKRIEEIGSALGTSTKELVLPVKKLLLAKTISTKGEKRATRYFGR
ncbi:MAG TPA: hypothetical protein VMS65_10470 [Polyangiaceae bacterium]|nr:hypothetical protein [Polyangiaceae bacterium]